MDLLQEYFLIPLDIFRKITHNEISKLEAWPYFLSSDKPEEYFESCREISGVSRVIPGSHCVSISTKGADRYVPKSVKRSRCQ